MLDLYTNYIELRGVQNVTSKKGNVYYVLNCENCETGEAYQFFVRDKSVFPEKMKKGDKLTLLLTYNSRYKELNVKKIMLEE